MMKPVVVAVAMGSCFGLKHDIEMEFENVQNLLSKLHGKSEGIRSAAYNMKDVNEHSMAKLHAMEEQEASAFRNQASLDDSEFEKLKASLEHEVNRHLLVGE
jgi:hypothetical protein